MLGSTSRSPSPGVVLVMRVTPVGSGVNIRRRAVCTTHAAQISTGTSANTSFIPRGRRGRCGMNGLIVCGTVSGMREVLLYASIGTRGEAVYGQNVPNRAFSGQIRAYVGTHGA